MEHVGLRLLVDVGVGKKVERWLQEHGHDAKSVRDIDPKMSDKEILRQLFQKNGWWLQWIKILENWFTILDYRMVEFYY